MTWTVATYQPTALFSLRPALSTASGGQTLVVPTPFALKMGLLDVAIRGWGLAQGQTWFPAIRDLRMAVAGPERLVVTNTFIKIQRLKKNGPSDTHGTGIVGPLGPTIAFRAFVQFGGLLHIALAPGEPPASIVSATGRRRVPPVSPPSDPPPLAALLVQLNYLGKRGGFLQVQGPPEEWETLPLYPAGGFVELTQSSSAFPLDGLLQVLDDCGAGLRFEQANVYDSHPLQVGRDRVFHQVALPYQLRRSSRHYQLYERLPEQEEQP